MVKRTTYNFLSASFIERFAELTNLLFIKLICAMKKMKRKLFRKCREAELRFRRSQWLGPGLSNGEIPCASDRAVKNAGVPMAGEKS
jgi:hypothetical protein